MTAQRRLDLFVFNLQLIEGETVTSHAESLERMRALGLPMIPFYARVSTAEEIIREVERIGEQRNALPFDIDGAVVKVDNLAQRELLGTTSKFPKWAVAFKYPPEEKQTTLLDVEVAVGRTGVLTPTGVFAPVTLAGTTVSRATLHNEDFIREKELHYGDTVVLRKAGDIIPEVVRVVAHAPGAQPITLPDRCPSCGSPVTREEGEAALRCTNPDCPAQRMRHLIHFASRDAMDIEGMGPAVIGQLLDAGLIRHLDDMYRLDRDAVAAIDRMGEKSADNLLAAVEESKSRGLARVLFGLGIRHIGQKAAKLIAERFGSMEAVMAASHEQLCAIDGIGGVLADSLLQFFTLPASRELIAHLAQVGVEMTDHTERADDRFAGMTFVLTGTLPTLKREEASALIEKYGGKTSSSVSKKTSVVLAGEEAGSKLDKARTLGVRIIDEAEFRDMLA